MTEATNDTTSPVRPLRDALTFLLIVSATFGLQLLTLVTGIIMARLLGVEGRGVIALVLAVSVFAAQLSFGGCLPPAITKLLAERGANARDGLGHVFRRRGWLLLLPCLVAGGLMLVLLDDGAAGQRFEIAVIAVVVTLQTLFFSIIGGAMQGEGRLVRMAWVALTPQGLFTIALAVVAALDWGWSATDVLLAYIATGVLSVLVAMASLLPAERGDDVGAERRVPEASLWSEARGNYVSGVRPLDGLGLERILVGGLLGTTALGLFATGLAVSNLCRLVSNAVSVVVLPRVAAHQGDPAQQRAVVRRWFTISLVLVGGIVAVLELLVEPVIRLAFGEEFVGAVSVARWLIVADGLLALRRVLIAALQGQGRGGVASWVELALLPVLVVGIALSALRESLDGVGMSLAAVGLLSCLALGRAVFRAPSARHRGRATSCTQQRRW
ncbi:lipopolysaccharide biosynthesis protein [Aeromicrobium sp. Sec7.5]|uniref:lipopolysaccharide biosynthesis protein n=1 Tax=Aeromicrobium sp. Sec7.5 TaxID=3121276 RepID=UPI002FE44902